MSATLRTRLILLVLVTLLPGLLAGAWVLASAYDAERDAQERLLAESARALLQVVDSELARRATVAQVLTQSRTLDDGEQIRAAGLREFDSAARRAMQGLGGWVELHAPGRLLLSTRWPPGQAPAAATATAQGGQSGPSGQSEPEPPAVPAVLLTTAQVLPLQEVQLTGKAAASAAPAATPATTSTTVPTTAPPAAARPYIAVLEPVQRQGATVLNLRVTMRPAELQAIIDRQNMPARSVAAVLDDRGVVVARHPGGAEYVGRRATADVLARLAAGQSGRFESTTLEGMRSTAFNQIGGHGWAVVTAIPRDPLAATVPRTVLQVGLGGLVLLTFAMAGALWLARRIARPVQALKLAADRLQAGQPVAATTTGIVECDEVALALAGASQTLLRNRSELESQVAAAVERTRRAEQRIAQSQRSEALGRLTGGVAHDVNNLLGVISNSTYLIQRHADGRPELEMPLGATLRAVEAGSRLTQHLLRVAGQRPVRPQPLALRSYMPQVEDLLRSVLGRHVTLHLRVAADVRAVVVDPSELELAFINLALNARDAMSGRGELRLQAGNADAAALADWAELLPATPVQAWVELAVSDNGAGMDSSLAASVFEPFFTTQPVGRGTGLGLAQVHGFCAQAGGAVRLDSTPGLGTTVRMLLPAQAKAEEPSHATSNEPANALSDVLSNVPESAPLALQTRVQTSVQTSATVPPPDAASMAAARQTTLPAPPQAALPAGLAAQRGPDQAGPLAGSSPDADSARTDIAGARLLLVEDNAGLAEVTLALLRMHGALVFHAGDAAQALRMLESSGPVDLVLSDIVMPGPVDGLALARLLRQQQPQLPVILTSGYAAPSASAMDFVVLRKPCAQADLLATLHAALQGTLRLQRGQ